MPEAQQLLARFGCTIAPAKGINRVIFPRAWLAISNPHHDAKLWAMAGSRLGASIHDTDEPHEVAAVREFVVQMLDTERRVPRLKQAAMHLGLSTRTIARSLARHDTSYHRLVEEERKARALALIGDASLSLADVAETLGFNDMSSFGRSFRLWFGDTPGHQRKRLFGQALIAWRNPCAHRG
ncbi:MAG: helix-turn-helix domain-containing protein [Erythrobacter sp.]